MTPSLPDHDVIRNRLRVIEDSLDALAGAGEPDADRLGSDPIMRAAIERLLSRIVEQAVEINSHLAATRLRRAPSTYRESFNLVRDAGIINTDLCEELMRSVAMRNIIVHSYVDLDLILVSRAVPLALRQYREYVSSVAAFLLTLDDSS